MSKLKEFEALLNKNVTEGLEEDDCRANERAAEALYNAHMRNELTDQDYTTAIEIFLMSDYIKGAQLTVNRNIVHMGFEHANMIYVTEADLVMRSVKPLLKADLEKLADEIYRGGQNGGQ